MKLSYEDYEAISVLTISGELTAEHADTFRRATQERFGAGIRDLVLDMQYLTFVDSAGLELLLWLTEKASQHDGQIRLVNPDVTVRKILEITRLDRRFDVHDTVESAAKSLR